MVKRYREKTYSYTYNHVHNKLLYKEINYIEKEQLQNRCIVHLINGDEKIVPKTILNIKKELGPMFFQTHKSCIINLDNIKKVNFARFTIYFKNGDSVNLLSHDARKELRKIVGDY